MLSADERKLETIAAFVYRKFGIYIGKDKYERLELKLENIKKYGSCSGTDELCTLLASGNQSCLDQLARCVTTCHTFFFREPEHFFKLAEDIRTRKRRRIIIWCAACSTGEEPYSIAMTLLDNGITDFHIVASDLNADVLTEFNTGIYHESRLSQTPAAVRRRYFTPENGGYYRIDRTLRKYISIKKINLMADTLFQEPFDYIFCRNVFIYFDENSRGKALRTIVRNMKISGQLFIGHAEVLLQLPDNLEKTGNSNFCRKY